MAGDLTTTEDIAQALLPFYFEGTKKANYLGYVVAGFSTTQAAKLAKLHFRTVQNWRQGDPKFAELEQKAITDLREQLSNTILDIEFTRNFRLVLVKDFEILYKDATGGTLTEEEQKYILVIRKFYTPQQLGMIKQLLSGGDKPNEALDWTKTVLEIRLSKETGTTK